MSKQMKITSGKDFDYASLPPYMQKEFVERRARKEAKEVFADKGNYDLYYCKPDEYYVPSYYTKDGTWVIGHCRKFAKNEKRRR